MTLLIALTAAPDVALAQRPATAPGGSDGDAARLELLVLRAAIARDIPVRPDSVVVAPARAPVSADSAAAIMARLTKPTVCQGIAHLGVLTVTCTPLTAEAPELVAVELLARYTPKYGSIAGGGGVLGFVRANSPVALDTAHVLVIGRDTTVMPVPVMERWERDYYEAIGKGAPTYNMGGFSADDGERSNGPGGLDRRSGVVAIYQFSSSADRHGASIITSSFGGTERPTEDDRLASLADRLTSISMGADEGMLRPALARVADMFSQQWKGRGMPPMAAAFVERYGSRDAPSH